MEMRECGACNYCCSGHLIGNAYGNQFYMGRKCVFLKENCLIHSSRPECCKKYQCAWSQGILPDSLYPPTCGFIISVEVDKNGKQFLKIPDTSKATKEDLYIVEEWCKQHGTYLIK